jgi:hypothetical protein
MLAASALPYVDKEYDEIPGMETLVDDLLKEEMKQYSGRPDYISHLPAPELTFEVR